MSLRDEVEYLMTQAMKNDDHLVEALAENLHLVRNVLDSYSNENRADTVFDLQLAIEAYFKTDKLMAEAEWLFAQPDTEHYEEDDNR